MKILLLRFCSAICLLLIFKETLGSYCIIEKERILRTILMEDLKKLAIANNEFGLNLYRIMSREKKNIVYSPLYISSALAMVYEGAEGDTADELRSVLGYDQADLSSETVDYAFYRFLAYISITQRFEYQLSLANAIFLDARLNISKIYKSGVGAYNAEVREVYFSRSNNFIVNEMNSFVRSKTNNKIDHVVDQLDHSQVIVLLIAVYFKGTWHTKFNEQSTFPRKFHKEGSRSKTTFVPFMHSTSTYKYAETDDFKGLELPYKGGYNSMIILLPNRMKGYRKLQNKLTHKKLSSIRESLSERTVEVKLPKFKLEYRRSLVPDLQELGIRSLFLSGFANLSGMTTERDLHISSVFHKAMIEVDEEGYVSNNRIYRPNSEIIPIFDADHPFLFFIIDKKTDLILFSGRVSDF